jgi:zinc protease
MTNLHSLPGPDDITRVQLSNGVVVLTRPNFNSPSVALAGYLPAGAIFDPDEKLGLADFTASALMRGTARRDFQGIYDALESAGASLGFDSGTHTTSFGGRSLTEDLDLLLELLSESLRQPAFQRTGRAPARAAVAGLQSAQDTGDMASMAFDQIVYAGHPYSRPEDGYIETVQAITRQDLADHHRRHFGPRGMVVVVVGAVEPAQVVERVEKALGDWRNPEQPEQPSLPDLTPYRTYRETGDHPRKYRPICHGRCHVAALFDCGCLLGNSVLGQFGMWGASAPVRSAVGLLCFSSVAPDRTMEHSAGVAPWIKPSIDPSEIARFMSEPGSAMS